MDWLSASRKPAFERAGPRRAFAFQRGQSTHLPSRGLLPSNTWMFGLRTPSSISFHETWRNLVADFDVAPFVVAVGSDGDPGPLKLLLPPRSGLDCEMEGFGEAEES